MVQILTYQNSKPEELVDFHYSYIHVKLPFVVKVMAMQRDTRAAMNGIRHWQQKTIEHRVTRAVAKTDAPVGNI